MIGFFGGSFDPVHYGHLKIARAIKKELKLDKLFLMPCKSPVHKNTLYFSNEQRIKMLNLALIEFNDLQIDTREIDRQGESYTIDTLKHIKIDFPNKNIFLIIGEDNFNILESWKGYQQFSDYAQLVVLPRTSSAQKINTGIDVYFANTPLINISSTQIRDILSNISSIGKIDKIGKQQNVSGLLPKNIIKYIQKL